METNSSEHYLVSIFTLITFIIILFVVPYLGKKLNLIIDTKHIVIAIIVVTFILGILGYIKTFKYSKMEIAFKEASNKPIKLNISELPIQDINYERKDGKDYLIDIVNSRPVGLSFQMGYQNYDPNLMGQYLKQLAGSVKYIFFYSAFDDPKFQGALICSIELSKLNQILFREDNIEGLPDYLDIKTLYHIIDKNDIRGLLKIKGMIPNFKEITPYSSKIDILQRMENYKTSYLPVNDTTSYRQRIITKEEISTSLLLDIAKSIR